MPFLDHLEEMRWRILWSLLAIVIGTVIGWLILERVDIVALLKRPIAPYLPGGRLTFTSPAEPFMLTLKVSFALGCLLASPIVIYQLWAFLSPALYVREKRLIVPALSVGVVLFLGGAIACYEWLLPAALKVLLGFQQADLTPMITIDRYFGMAIPFIVGCGLIAELPLVVTILSALGIVTPQFLARQRRYAIVVSAFVAALLTPPDAVSMVLMLVPLLLLYEISIWCAWIASRRRARRTAAALLLVLIAGAGSAAAQAPPTPPAPPTPQDTSRRGNLDTATARRLGLPTGPTRTFPPADRIIDSLLKLSGYRITRYVADTLVVEGDSQTIVLKREAFVERDSTQVEADSIRYREATCRLDAAGDPRLFDRGTVLIGEGMRYDTCTRRGTVRDALTDFQQGGATWYVRGNLALDSGSTRIYAAAANFTSDPQPVPDYHFSAGQVKWINKRWMIARPAVLYVRDVPIMWLPFIFQDIRGGRRSGILVPRFGLNDLVRPSRSYSRHITDLGYYFAVNDYLDLLISGDWFAGRSVSFTAQTKYRWLDRFMSGGLSFTRTSELDRVATMSRIGWVHAQQFDSRTRFNAQVDYSTNGSVIQRNSLNPFEVTSTIGSSLNFSKQLSWGTLNIGGTRRQDISRDQVTQSFPTVNLTPSAVNITPSITWSPGFSFSNQQTFHNPVAPLLIPAPPGGTAAVDTLALFADSRTTQMSFQTPIRFSRWNWFNSISVTDVVSNHREEFVIDTGGSVTHLLLARRFETQVNWETGINLPPLLTGSWKIQPGIAILNQTSAGPFMLRNEFTQGEFVRQGKRLAFSVSASPAFFGFFPGFGPLLRIRHSISPGLSYQFAPGSTVDERYRRALDPTDTTLNARSDPQQTISLTLSQNFEAKLKPPPGDTAAEPRKIRLLSINTSSIGYNFEQAKQPGRVGWTTQTLSNTFASDLVPGFSLSIGHDLWDGQVGRAGTRFDPFLTTVSSSFAITPATVQGIASLLGLRRRPAPPPLPLPADTASQATVPGTPPVFPGFKGPGGSAFPGSYTTPGLGGRRGFSLQVAYSKTRSRADTGAARNLPGRETTTLNLSFSPTRNWSASWSTAYDFNTRQFAQHFLSFERDLHRWRASFTFAKSGNGNFSFSFNIALSDQPDIKFDYDQRTFVRP